MKKFILAFILVSYSSNLFSQRINEKNDTLNSNISLPFLKVRPSFKGIDTAHLDLSYIKKDDKILMNFLIPSYIFRNNTTINDYFVIHSNNNTYKIQNEKEEVAVKNTYYKFLGSLPKKDFLEILNSNIKKIVFYFTPNDSVRIKIEQLANGIKLSEFDRHIIKLSSRTMKIKVLNPQKEYREIIKQWINSLKN